MLPECSILSVYIRRREMKSKAIVLLLLTISSLFLIGCSKQPDEYSDGDKCYSSRSVMIEDCDGIRRVEYTGEEYYLFTDYYDIDENTGDIVDRVSCYTVDQGKNLNKIITLEKDDIIDICITGNDDIAVLTRDEIGCVDPESGEYSVLTSELPEEVRYANGHVLFRCDDRLALILDGKVLLYDEDGTMISSVENDLLTGIVPDNGFYGDSESAYLALDKNGKIDYYLISWEDHRADKITDSDELGLDYTAACQGIPYCVDPTTCDVYEIDLDRCEADLYASGNNMLIPPTNDGFSGYGDMRIADQDHIVSIRNIDSDCEVVFIEADPDLSLSGREIIKVGCTDIINAPSIKQAVYLYNCSQEEYLAVIEEYEIDYSDPTQSILELTASFNSGNAPDIYCGNYFDYDSWGRAGMVIDIAPYIQADDGILGSVASSWTDKDGKCYSVFASFSLSGFFTTSEYYGSNDLSIDAIPDPGEGHSIYGGGITADNLAYYTILGELQRSNDREISAEDMTRILEYAISYGVPPSGNVNYIGFRNIADGDVMLVGGSPWGADEFISLDEQVQGHIVFVGYPSIDGSSHIINPNSRVAISSESQNQQACIDLVRILFDDEIQEQCLLNPNCGIPVVEHILEDYLEEKMIEDDLAPDSVQAYIDYADSGDQVILLDNGLYDIVVQEVDSYYINDIPIEQIAESLASRINLYVKENR